MDTGQGRTGSFEEACELSTLMLNKTKNILNNSASKIMESADFDLDNIVTISTNTVATQTDDILCIPASAITTQLSVDLLVQSQVSCVMCVVSVL